MTLSLISCIKSFEDIQLHGNYHDTYYHIGNTDQYDEIDEIPQKSELTVSLKPEQPEGSSQISSSLLGSSLKEPIDISLNTANIQQIEPERTTTMMSLNQYNEPRSNTITIPSNSNRYNNKHPSSALPNFSFLQSRSNQKGASAGPVLPTFNNRKTMMPNLPTFSSTKKDKSHSPFFNFKPMKTEVRKTETWPVAADFKRPDEVKPTIENLKTDKTNGEAVYKPVGYSNKLVTANKEIPQQGNASSLSVEEYNKAHKIGVSIDQKEQKGDVKQLFKMIDEAGEKSTKKENDKIPGFVIYDSVKEQNEIDNEVIEEKEDDRRQMLKNFQTIVKKTRAILARINSNSGGDSAVLTEEDKAVLKKFKKMKKMLINKKEEEAIEVNDKEKEFIKGVDMILNREEGEVRFPGFSLKVVEKKQSDGEVYTAVKGTN